MFTFNKVILCFFSYSPDTGLGPCRTLKAQFICQQLTMSSYELISQQLVMSSYVCLSIVYNIIIQYSFY